MPTTTLTRPIDHSTIDVDSHTIWNVDDFLRSLTATTLVEPQVPVPDSISRATAPYRGQGLNIPVNARITPPVDYRSAVPGHEPTIEFSPTDLAHYTREFQTAQRGVLSLAAMRNHMQAERAADARIPIGPTRRELALGRITTRAMALFLGVTMGIGGAGMYREQQAINDRLSKTPAIALEAPTNTTQNVAIPNGITSIPPAETVPSTSTTVERPATTQRNTTTTQRATTSQSVTTPTTAESTSTTEHPTFTEPVVSTTVKQPTPTTAPATTGSINSVPPTSTTRPEAASSTTATTAKPTSSSSTASPAPSTSSTTTPSTRPSSTTASTAAPVTTVTVSGNRVLSVSLPPPPTA